MMNRLFAIGLTAVLLAPASSPAQVRVVALSSGETALSPALDSAINKLEGFLSSYPESPLRPRALLQLGELLVQRADENFAQNQRSAGAATPDSAAHASAAATPGAGPAPTTVRPDYSAAIARYEELVNRFPDFEQIDAALYTLGTLYASAQRWPEAAGAFERVSAMRNSSFRPEALFRLGDARFEVASRERGPQRRAMFGDAAVAYEQAVASSQPPSDIYFLALYKLGWSYYNQANQANQNEYRKAVDVFGRLVDAYDKLTPEQQARLGLRSEAIEYMAVAFTQVGGADAANRYFASHGGAPYKLALMRRVATSLRDQGNFPEAIRAYQIVISEAPTDSSVLTASYEIADIYQNRLLALDSAQTARLALAQRLAPGTPWAKANPQLADSAAKLREAALRQSGQYVLAAAQSGQHTRYAEAAQIYSKYLQDFPRADSAQIVNRYYAEALLGAGNFTQAGAAFAKTAYGYNDKGSALAQEAGRNAIVAFDSALTRNKSDRAAQDSLFSAVDRFVAAFPNTDLAKKALIQKGRRASETKRWDAMAEAFRTYATMFPNDPYLPTAQRLVGDALYKDGQYSQAQQQWEQAQQVAAASGRRALADSIGALRTAAAESYADSLIKRGQYKGAAENVYVAFAKNNPNSPKAPDALRNAIETYMLADSVARRSNNQDASREARDRVIELSAELAQRYPNYKYTMQYQTLRARLLAENGKRDESVQAYQQLIAQNPNWSGRPDAMVRVAVMLDSLGKKQEAAAAYDQFATAYPQDKRAPGALWNAAATYAEAGDQRAAAMTYAKFANRYPADSRAAQARRQQVSLLQNAGDSAAAGRALSEACSRPSAELRAECGSRVAEREFRNGVATFGSYQPLRLTISSKSQLNAAGVARASQQKQALLRQLTGQFSEAIRSGVPSYIAAASYYVGLAQWEYGNFLKDVGLPDGLTDAERTAAEQGAAQEAEQYFAAARKIWNELGQKASSTPEIGKDANAAPWVRRASDAAQGKVDTTPPSVVGGGR